MDDNGKSAGSVVNFKPGALSREGFMGDDPRSPEEVVEADRAELAKLGLTACELGERMEELSERAIAALGCEIEVRGLSVNAVEARGSLVCPFGEGGLYNKAVIAARKPGEGEIAWSLLSVHLVKVHGFFGGRGSAFRLDPAVLAGFLPF